MLLLDRMDHVHPKTLLARRSELPAVSWALLVLPVFCSLAPEHWVGAMRLYLGFSLFLMCC